MRSRKDLGGSVIWGKADKETYKVLQKGRGMEKVLPLGKQVGKDDHKRGLWF